MSEDKHGPPRWEADPSEQLTNIAAEISDVLGNHTEELPGLRGIITIADGQGGTAAGMYGYGELPGVRSIADFIKFSTNLFAASGIRMTLKYTVDGQEVPSQDHEPPLAESDPGQPEVELVIRGMASDEEMERAVQAVTSALRQDDSLAETRIVVLLGRGARSVLLHHGYDDEHKVIHTLVAALTEAVERDSSGRIMVIPLGGHPN